MSVLATLLRGAARRPVRLLLTGLAVAVASFFAFAVIVAQQVTERTVMAQISGTPAATALVVSTENGVMPAATLAALRGIPGVAEVAPRLDGHVARADAPDDFLLSIDTDPGSGPLARVRVVTGDYPDAAGEVAVTQRTAQRLGLLPGARVGVLPPGGKATTLTVTGVVDAPGDDGFNLYAPDTVTAPLFDLGYTRFDLRADPGTSIDALALAVSDAVQPMAPQAQVAYAEDVRAGEAREEVEEIEPVFVLLGMFVVIAMIAAVLVAASTFRIVFTQRMRQLALLRAVGATRGRLFRELAAEGVVTGLVAGVAGVTVAGGLAQVAPIALGLFDIRISYPGFPLGSAVGVVVGAVAVTLLAVVAPAVSAAKVSPLEALRSSATADGQRRAGIVRLAFGALLALAAAGTAALVLVQVPNAASPDVDYDIEQQLLLTILSGTLAFGALLTLGPVLLPSLLRLVSWPIRRGSPVGRLAVGGVGGSPRRVAAVSAVVALGVTLIGGTLVASASLRSLAEAEIAGSYPADIEVSGGGDRALPAGFAERLRGRKEIARVVPYRSRTIAATVGEKSVEFRATDLNLRALPATQRLPVADGSLAEAGPGRVVMGLTVADILGVRSGDTVRLVLGRREVEVRVVATLSGSVPLGMLLADPADFDRLGVPRTPSGILVDAVGSAGTARNAAQAAVRSELGKAAGIQIDILADARDEVRGWLAALTAAALGLLGLTVLIGAVGVGTTTALSVVERVRESGLLRAVGLSRAALRTMLTTEAGLYGVLGSVIGLALGVPYAWLAVLALGIDAPLLFPVAQLAVVVVTVAGLTAAAGLLPARRAAKVSPVAALGTD